MFEQEKKDARWDGFLSGCTLTFSLIVGSFGVYDYGQNYGAWGQSTINKDGLEIARSPKYILTKYVENPVDMSKMALFRLRPDGTRAVLVDVYDENSAQQAWAYLSTKCSVIARAGDVALVENNDCLKG